MISIEYRALPRVRRAARRPRIPVVATAIARALSPVPPKRRTRLHPLLVAVWQLKGDELWTTRDLRLAGLVEAGEVHRLGHELRRALERGGRVGDFTLVRLDKEDRGARLWRLACGDL